MVVWFFLYIPSFVVLVLFLAYHLLHHLYGVWMVFFSFTGEEGESGSRLLFLDGCRLENLHLQEGWERWRYLRLLATKLTKARQGRSKAKEAEAIHPLTLTLIRTMNRAVFSIPV
ncbi:hypothetical protein V8F33_004232 [Rhypophila sp. PSN 637]